MRRLLPLWSSLFAVLLLSQWAGAGAACLPHLAGYPRALCIAAAASDDHPAQDQAAPATCPLCAPLPPAILPGPGPVATAPAILPAPALLTTLAWTVPPTTRPTPLQARAPPA